METHVKALAALQIALSALSLLFAIVLMLIFGGVMGAVTAADDPDAMVALPVIGLTGAALVSFLLVLSLPGLITGIGLLQRRPWARIAGIVISIIGMMFIPFGTLIGVYGLWVLFSKETEPVHAPHAGRLNGAWRRRKSGDRCRSSDPRRTRSSDDSTTRLRHSIPCSRGRCSAIRPRFGTATCSRDCFRP